MPGNVLVTRNMYNKSKRKMLQLFLICNEKIGDTLDEMVYQSTVQQELDKVEEAKNSLSGIADLAKQLKEAIEEKLLLW